MNKVIELTLSEMIGDNAVAVANWLEGLDSDDYNAIDDRTPFALDSLKSSLESPAGIRFTVFDRIETHVQDLIDVALARLREKANDLTEVSYDFGKHLPDAGCHALCNPIKFKYAAVSVIAKTIFEMAKGMIDTVGEGISKIPHPLREPINFIKFIMMSIIIILFILACVILILFPEAVTTGSGVAGLKGLLTATSLGAGAGGSLLS